MCVLRTRWAMAAAETRCLAWGARLALVPALLDLPSSAAAASMPPTPGEEGEKKQEEGGPALGAPKTQDRRVDGGPHGSS